MTPHDKAKLVGVHPTEVAAIEKTFAAMEAHGFTMMVTDGVRTLAQQQAKWAQGRTTPGHIVTDADGIHVRSNHQVHSDGYGHAADCCFVVNGQPSWDLRLPWHLYGEAGEANGLKWGGRFPKYDGPHLELPFTEKP